MTLDYMKDMKERTNGLPDYIQNAQPSTQHKTEDWTDIERIRQFKDSAEKVRHIWNQQDRDRLTQILDKWLENRLSDDDKLDIARYADRIKYAPRPIREDLIQLMSLSQYLEPKELAKAIELAEAYKNKTLTSWNCQEIKVMLYDAIERERPVKQLRQQIALRLAKTHGLTDKELIQAARKIAKTVGNQHIVAKAQLALEQYGSLTDPRRQVLRNIIAEAE